MLPVVEYRRALHRIPELDNQLPETCAYVSACLERFGLTAFSPIPGSVCAFVDAGRAETAAFRADMDALPVEEPAGLPFASVHPGRMHACGHDGHTAMVLALAEYAAAHREDLPRNALFLFQPAEETTGGAERVCGTGMLEVHQVTRVFGLHLWPHLEAGKVFSRPGPLMARSNEVTVTITGKSVHLSRAEQGLDALTAGAEYLRRVYAAVEALPPSELRVLRFGKMVSGTVRNAVSGETVLEGSLRTYREETWALCHEVLDRTGREIEAETGCRVALHLNEGNPAVWNHEELYAAVCAGLGDAAPWLLEAPVLAAEDFSYYQKAAPGVFFFLGIGPSPELHAREFCFDDEAVLPRGVEFLTRLLLLD